MTKLFVESIFSMPHLLVVGGAFNYKIMAIRRMFSKTITSSSQFLMMPQSAQNLYFHLGMNADDDGFCEHFTIMRMTESKPDDLKILQAKSFVKIFDEKVLVIMDWKENNYIRNDRYSASKYLETYKEELKRLSSGIPEVDKRDTQVRLGKVRLGKDKKENYVGKADPPPFSYKEKLETMKKDKRKHIKIISYFWQYKAILIDNEKQYQTLLKRSLKPASELTGFSFERINEVMDWLANVSNMGKWELETVLKYISEDLDNLKPFGSKKQNYGNF